MAKIKYSEEAQIKEPIKISMNRARDKL
jgi:hypothetical protein